MRLICPNCDAQYEVDDSVIPNDGRDVQCSSCGQTWFQKSAAQLEEEGDAQEETASPVLSPDAEPDVQSGPESQPDVQYEPEPEPEVEPDPVTEPEPEQEQESEPEPAFELEPEPEPELEQVAESQKLDDGVLDILREEAERETEARQNEAQSGLETQPDLGLEQSVEEVSIQVTTVTERTARLRGIEPEVDKTSLRSDILPDIEEINSTLRATSEDEGDTVEEAVIERQRGKRGFRLGFSLIIILATSMVLLYSYAPQIVEKMPASEPFMNSYVEKMDGLRLWLDQLMKSATAGMSDSGGSGS